jgi:AcrR family transcriptional regulator
MAGRPGLGERVGAVNLRETNKADKRKRIQQAALRLFSTQGYDSTSTREIASLAGVGLATLFLYADDKRDLLFLAANDDLESLTETAFAKIRRTTSLFDQLIGIFRHFFEFYDGNRMFSRDLLRELTFYTSGRQSARFQATRQATIFSIERVIAEVRERGGMSSASSDECIAEAIFYLFAADVRRWLGQERSSIADGLHHLGALFSVLLTGLGCESPKNTSRTR